MNKLIICSCLLWVFAPSTLAQSGTPIQIVDNYKIVVNETDSFKYLIGSPAIIRQGNTLFKGDSIFICDKLQNKVVEVYGNVYINDNDSVITKSNYLKFFRDTRVAQLRTNVSITSKNNGTFTGQEVDYDMNLKLATYKNGGTINSKNTKLTSKNGQYYTNSKDALFSDDVKLNTQDDDVSTDTLLYNVNNEIATFVSYTKIVNRKKGRVLETTKGTYDMKNRKGRFTERTRLKDNDKNIVADDVDYDEKTQRYILQGNASINDKSRNAKADKIIDIDEKNKIYHLEGNAYIEDKEKNEKYRGQKIDLNGKEERYSIDGNGLYSNEKEGIVITGNELRGDNKTGKSLATGKPVVIIKQENDSIFIAADTLYGGRIINNKKIIIDSTKGTYYIDTISKVKDTFRFFEGFHHVKIFSDSVQAISDSIYYSTVDSIFRLFQNPIVWNVDNQATGDTMLLYTKNKKIKKMEIFENAFVINRVPQSNYFNQIRSNYLSGFFKNGEIDSLTNKGSAEIIFYIQDDEKAFIGVDKSSADVIQAYFANKEIYKLKWLNKYNANTTPMKDVNHDAMQLRGYNNLFHKRPKSKLELFF
jgi:lipopolysaccharide export system protein LptA